MNNNKKLTIILAVLALVCVFAALVFSGVIKLDMTVENESTTDAAEKNGSDAYKADMTSLSAAPAPYLPTNIQNIYYSVSKDGTVKFYKYADAAFTETEATGTYKATVTLSEEDYSADITYYKDGGQITGFGLYTAESDSYSLYPYAFFRLTNYGASYEGRSSKSCLLLVDTTQDDFYAADKVYEESFIFNYADSSTARALSEANRTVGMNGAKRSDYFVINDTLINHSFKYQLFFSGRQYSEDDPRVDLLRSGGSGNNTDNINLASDALANWVKQTDKGILYLTVDENKNVILVKTDNDGKSHETVKTFEDVKRDDILVSGDYLYMLSKNVVYDIANDKEIKVAVQNISAFKADAFAADSDTFVIRGYRDNLYPTLIIVRGDEIKEYTNEFFRKAVNFVIASDGRVIFATEEKGAFVTDIF